jgi:hypothetical protein
MPEDILLENKADLALFDEFRSVFDLAEFDPKHADAASRPLLLHGQHLEQCSLASATLAKNS